jgi:hypothetical protein
LIDADREKKSREFRDRFLAQISATIQIVCALLIAVGKMCLIRLDVARQAASDVLSLALCAVW